MKLIKFIGFIGIISLCHCCDTKENDLCPQSQLKGSSTCNTNYKPWVKGFGYLYKTNGLFQISIGQVDENCNTESIAIKSNELKIGKIYLNFSIGAMNNFPTSKFSTIHGQDAQTEQYDLLKSYINVLEITRFNKDSSIINGTFDLAYVISEISTSKFDVNRPDTLYFKNGVFELILKE